MIKSDSTFFKVHTVLSGLLVGLLLMPGALLAAEPVIQPGFKLPSVKTPLDRAPIQPTVNTSFVIKAPACVKKQATFYVSGADLVKQGPKCVAKCAPSASPRVTTTPVSDSQVKCVVQETPTTGYCQLGAMANGRWLVSKKTAACRPANRDIAPIMPQKSLVKPRQGIQLQRARPGGFTRELKPVGINKDISPDGNTRRSENQLQHTTRLSLAMTGLGDSTTRVWQPLVVSALQSLTMRGLGDTSTTIFKPINLTVTTSLSMKGVYTGDY